MGRERELAALAARVDAARAGHGGLAVLGGEAGIGKTAMARRFAEIAAARGAATLWGAAYEGEWQPPYGPWVEALGAYADGLDAGRLRAELGSGAPILASLVPEVGRRLEACPRAPLLLGIEPARPHRTRAAVDHQTPSRVDHCGGLSRHLRGAPVDEPSLLI